MTKQFLFLPLLLCFCVGNAQDIEFTDENFKQALIDEGVDSITVDGEISKEEALAVESLNLGSYVVENIEGIEYFTNLTAFYGGSGHKLTSLDFSGNKKLTRIHLYYGITVTNLNISENTELTLLELSYCSLTSLDISNNEKLTDLRLFGNDIKSLNVSNNNSLIAINLRENNNLEYVCTSDENFNLINDHIDSLEIIGVTVSTDCNEEEVVYEFSDLLDIGGTITITGVITLSVTDLGLEEGVELTSTFVYNINTGETASMFHEGAKVTTLDFSNLSAGTFVIAVTTNIGVFNSIFVKL